MDFDSLKQHVVTLMYNGRNRVGLGAVRMIDNILICLRVLALLVHLGYLD